MSESDETGTEFLRLGEGIDDKWWANDVTRWVTWVKKHRILWFTSRPEKALAMMVALAPNRPPVVLSGADRPAGLSALLVDELGQIPADLAPEQLANAIRWLTTALPGSLLSPREHEARARKDPLYLQLGLQPTIQREPTGAWKLEFRYLTIQGGVEHWSVEGTPKAIVSARVTMAAPPGTIRWPFI